MNSIVLTIIFLLTCVILSQGQVHCNDDSDCDRKISFCRKSGSFKNLCVYKLNYDVSCNRNAQCGTNWCWGNIFGLSTGKCTATDGTKCSDDRHCSERQYCDYKYGCERLKGWDDPCESSRECAGHLVCKPHAYGASWCRPPKEKY